MKVKYPLAVAAVLVLVLLAALAANHFLRSTNAVIALQRGHYKQAVKHLRKDADNGDLSALTALANLHHLGLGVPRRPEMSVRLYSQAAFAGNASIAYAWYNLARDSGSQVAQAYMSELLAEHRLTYHKVIEVKMNYATINNFEKLHE